MINVDKVYVLTINRHQNRRERISALLNGIDFEFYYGFDAPLSLDGFKFISDIPLSFFKDNQIDFEFVKRWNIGQLGAYYSIREMLQNAYLLGFNRVLFFEDDIVAKSGDFIKEINNALANLPENWELLQLGFEFDGRLYKYAYWRIFRPFLILFNFLNKIFNFKPIIRLPKRLNKCIDQSGNSFGGHAFILNRKGLEKLLKNMYPLREGGDVLINSMITENRIKAFSIYPLLFRQLNKNDSSTR